ncbi:MAG: Flp pilus assembly complex ATPase component TadA [Erysipelotrichales bacterium]|nr:Flp pilus assembly complex ATPase component TadA [Erysipelotrichales bacterium]
MTNDQSNINNNELFVDENGTPVETQYVDELGNPIDPSLIDENGNYIGNTTPQYVDEYGNPIDPSLIDENGNYIGPKTYVDEEGNPVDQGTISQTEVDTSLNDIQPNVITATSASEHQMDNKELLQGMVTFDYNNVPITDIVNSIILDAINKGASDIHFDPFDDGIKIRIRIDGQLNDYSIVPLFVKKNMITRVKIISGMNITESRTPQDGAIRTELANKTIDLRVSCLPTNMGEKIVIRIMDYSMSASGVEALDFSEKNLEKVQKMLKLPNGIILVTGATGSGKSTTVYSMLQKLNVEGTNLITVEDPIEMNIGGINQVQAVSEIGLTFATVLRSILRQDPDVIMIGEIRDDETARIAVRASITGHLVLSTIHTNNSLNTIERLTDMSVERYLLGTALSGIVSQKLARRLCEKCKRLRPTNEYEKEIFKRVLNKDIQEIYEPVGCKECSRGYRGRIAIQEVLLLNQAIQDAITKGVAKNVLRNLVYGENGTETMLQDGLEKVLEGKTSFDEIIKLIDLEDDLGSGTQLGLEDQIDASTMTNNQNVTPVNLSNNPININITPELLESLNVLNNKTTSNDNNDEEIEEEIIVVKEPKDTAKKKTRRKIIEVEEDEIKDIVNDDNAEVEEEVIVVKEPKKSKKSTKTKAKPKVDKEIKIIDDNEEIETLENIEDNTPIEILDEVDTLDNVEQNKSVEIVNDIDTLDEFEDDNELESLDEFEEKNPELKNLENESISTTDIANIEIKEEEVSLEDLITEFKENLKQINKKKFPDKTKELANKIADFDINNPLIVDSVQDYIKAIKESTKLKFEVKEDLIKAFNRTFRLNEELDPIDQLTSETIETLNDINNSQINTYETPDIEEKISVDVTDENPYILEIKPRSKDKENMKIDINDDNPYNLKIKGDNNNKNEEKIKIDIEDNNPYSLEINNNKGKNAKEITEEDIKDSDFSTLDDEIITSLIDNIDEGFKEVE